MPADAGQILQRFEKLFSARSVIEQQWRECYDYTMPIRGQALRAPGALMTPSETANASRDRQAELFDSTATDCVRLLASSLMSGLTPANSRWFELQAEGVEDDAAETWLDEAADALWELIHSTNYDAVGFEGMLDMSIAGWCNFFIDEDFERGLSFDLWPLTGVYAAASVPGGRIDTWYRLMQMSAEQALNFYEGRVSESTRDKAQGGGRDDMVSFIQAIYPRRNAQGVLARNLPYASVHVEKQAKQIVRESGYHEAPCVSPRWTVIPDSVYAVGPTRDALPDIKTLNTLKQFVLANADLAIAGMWVATDDGVLNPKTLKIGPRKVIVAANPDNIKPLQPAGNFDVSALIVDELQRSIRKVMLADQLQPQDGPAMTATEVHVRVELIRQLLGPVYGRLQAEMLQPLVERCFGVAYRAGYFGPAPQALAGRNMTVHYRSPIARSQKLVDVSAMDRFEMSLMQAGQARPEVMDVYRWDDAQREKGEKLGVPLSLIVTEDELTAIREQQAAMQQAMNDAQAAGQLAALDGQLAKAGKDRAGAQEVEA
jgi:hypothetical protein